MVVPFSEGMLDVGAGHLLYHAQFGCPDAPAAVVLHGGPGSACTSSMLEWFDLSRQRIVLFDQRGSGKSTPSGYLARNTTQDLIEDIERLRRFLHISTWLVIGGSWGAMLAIAYASTYPESVRGMVLRGVFLPGPDQLKWFFQDLRALVPEAWAELTTDMVPAEKEAVLATLARRVLHGTEDESSNAAARWGSYEDAVMETMMGRQTSPQTKQRSGQQAKYRVQSHYLSHACFIDEPEFFLGARRVPSPVIFVHGTNDWICPPQNLIRIMEFMPQAEMRWVSGGTHTPSDPLIRDALRIAVGDAAGFNRTAGIIA